MKVSLIVATIGRVEPLARLLESLRAQSFRDFEVIIVDQNPQGFLNDCLKSFADLPLTRLQISPCGVSAARNAAFPRISGQIIGFPDDDCHYETNTLSSLVASFESHPEIGGVLAQWRPPGVAFSESKDIRITRRSAFFKGETHVQFYRKEAVDAIGLFDVKLGPGTGLPYACGEDTDYLLRALDAGVTIKRCHAIHTRHPAPEVENPDFAKLSSYGRGRMYLLKKSRFSLVFKVANVLHPLAMIPLERFSSVRYRMAMAKGRIQGLLEDLRGDF
jgi:GT2 family glycosyltransferase